MLSLISILTAGLSAKLLDVDEAGKVGDLPPGFTDIIAVIVGANVLVHWKSGDGALVGGDVAAFAAGAAPPPGLAGAAFLIPGAGFIIDVGSNTKIGFRTRAGDGPAQVAYFGFRGNIVQTTAPT